ncbi:MAG: hypothetical protein PHV93_00720 [Candidatus Pacebacteria bacterium]|nr:hypothetical protein [Candidatus Paceibacterota bacterium]
MVIDIVKVFLPSTVAFCMGIFITPFLTDYLYKHEMWKKKAGKVDMQGNATPIFNSLHKEKEVGTPRMGGIVIWGSTIVTVLFFFLLARIFPSALSHKIDFLSRNQTWLPLSTLFLGAIVGLIDDWLEIKGSRDHIAGGLSLKKRLTAVLVISLLCALWFYFKLGVSSIGLPFHFELPLGLLFIPFFMAVTVFIYSGGVIDGLDGLAGGVFASMFAAYAGIAFYQNQIDLAALCATFVGGIMAFLWFNIPPARYYMSETGTMGLTIALAVVAFLTDSLAGGYGILVLPVIALPLVLTTLSNIIQVLSKKYRGKKVFLVAPLHHHFEALGWPAYKVTMRYWIIGIIFAILGLILALIGK